MKKLLTLGTLLTLLFPAGAFAQRFADRTQAGYPPYGFRVFTDWQPSSLRIAVTPDDAQVFLDHTFLGAASSFSGKFRRLSLHAGPHLLELRKPGYDSVAFELNVYPAQTITVSQTMRLTRDDDDPSAPEAVAPALEEGAFLPVLNGPSGALRFDVTVKDAAIYADGFYVGIVDDFNGSQRMMLTQGRHHLVLRRDGYETLEANVTIDSERPVTYRTALTMTRNTPALVTASAATR